MLMLLKHQINMFVLLLGFYFTGNLNSSLCKLILISVVNKAKLCAEKQGGGRGNFILC